MAIESFEKTLCKVESEIRNPSLIDRHKLYARVRDAVAEIRIPDTDVREWTPGLIDTQGTGGVVKERRFFTQDICPDFREDIGYFVFHDQRQRIYSVRSFYINSAVFSNARFEEFVEALEARGLVPDSTNPVSGSIFASRICPASPEEVAKYQRERVILYL
jgi:hypothetical protein